MKNPIIAICLMASIVVFFSCKKDKTPDPTDAVKGQLQGTWRTTAFADDLNTNAMIDANEYYGDSNMYYIYTFSKDSVRVQDQLYDVKSDFTFGYTLSQDGKKLMFLGPYVNAYLYIDTLTSSRLVLRDNSDSLSDISWQILQKQ